MLLPGRKPWLLPNLELRKQILPAVEVFLHCKSGGLLSTLCFTTHIVVSVDSVTIQAKNPTYSPRVMLMRHPHKACSIQRAQNFLFPPVDWL